MFYLSRVLKKKANHEQKPVSMTKLKSKTLNLIAYAIKINLEIREYMTRANIRIESTLTNIYMDTNQ